MKRSDSDSQSSQDQRSQKRKSDAEIDVDSKRLKKELVIYKAVPNMVSVGSAHQVRKLV